MTLLIVIIFQLAGGDRSGLIPPFHHADRIEIFVRYSFSLSILVNYAIFLVPYRLLGAEIECSLATWLLHFMGNLHGHQGLFEFD